MSQSNWYKIWHPFVGNSSHRGLPLILIEEGRSNWVYTISLLSSIAKTIEMKGRKAETSQYVIGAPRLVITSNVGIMSCVSHTK